MDHAQPGRAQAKPADAPNEALTDISRTERRKQERQAKRQRSKTVIRFGPPIDGGIA